MAFNFGEILARQTQDTVNLQAQQQQSMMQTMNQLRMQEQMNMARMEEMRQRKLELDLRARVQAFQEAQELRAAEVDAKKLALQERLAKAQESMYGEHARLYGSQAKYFDERERTRKVANAASGAAGVLAATVRAGEAEIKGNTERAANLDAEVTSARRNVPGRKMFEDDVAYQARIAPQMDLAKKNQVTADSLRRASDTRRQAIIRSVEEFQKKYGVTPEQALQMQQQETQQQAPPPAQPGVLDDL